MLNTGSEIGYKINNLILIMLTTIIVILIRPGMVMSESFSYNLNL